MLRVAGLRKAFGGIVTLRDLGFDVRPGEMVKGRTERRR